MMLRKSHLAGPALALGFVTVLLTAWLGIWLTREAGRVASIWLSNAVLLGLILRKPVAQRPLLIGGYIGNITANTISGDALLLASALSLCNTLEVLFISASLRYRRYRFNLKITKETGSTQSAAQNISAVTRSLAERIESQAANLEEIAATVEELSKTTSSTAHTADTGARFAREAAARAEHGQSVAKTAT